jgi:hypothetical protein
VNDPGPPDVTLVVVQHGNGSYVETFQEINRLLLEALNHEVSSDPSAHLNGSILFKLDQADGEPWPSARFAHDVVIDARKVFSEQDPKLVESLVFKFVSAVHNQSEGTAPNSVAEAVSLLLGRLGRIRAWIRLGAPYRTAWQHLDDEAAV